MERVRFWTTSGLMRFSTGCVQENRGIGVRIHLRRWSLPLCRRSVVARRAKLWPPQGKARVGRYVRAYQDKPGWSIGDGWLEQVFDLFFDAAQFPLQRHWIYAHKHGGGRLSSAAGGAYSRFSLIS